MLAPLVFAALTPVAPGPWASGVPGRPQEPVRVHDTAETVPRIDAAVWRDVGSKIPAVELPRVDGGGLVDLAAYEGKKVLLLQFASW